MKPIHEALQSTSLVEVEEEIMTRYSLKSQMVGWLYPLILQDEIERLIVLKQEILKRLEKVEC